MTGEDTIVSMFPAGSAATTNGLLSTALDVGARMHVLPKFDATTFTEFMRSVDATIFYGAPAHLALWRQGEPDATPTARAYVVIGQAPSGVDVEWFLERRGSARLINAYGLTETCAGIMVGVDGDVAAGVLRPLAGVEVRLVEAAAGDASTDGELLMRSFGMMEATLSARTSRRRRSARDGCTRATSSNAGVRDT